MLKRNKHQDQSFHYFRKIFLPWRQINPSPGKSSSVNEDKAFLTGVLHITQIKGQHFSISVSHSQLAEMSQRRGIAGLSQRSKQVTDSVCKLSCSFTDQSYRISPILSSLSSFTPFPLSLCFSPGRCIPCQANCKPVFWESGLLLEKLTDRLPLTASIQLRINNGASISIKY